MLASLRKAGAPRSLAQLASATKESYPDAGWNLARWLQALRRGQAPRPLLTLTLTLTPSLTLSRTLSLTLTLTLTLTLSPAA